MFKTFETYNTNKKAEIKSKLDIFLEKEYDEINLDGQEIDGKLYDFFTIHDIEMSDLYTHLKKMSANIESIEFLKPNLIIHFKNEDISLKLEAKLSHYVDKNPIFLWKLSTQKFVKLKNIIKVQDSDKADFLSIYNSDNYNWFLKYKFKNISNKEDSIKRRIKLSKNEYTYLIENNGKIYRNFNKGDRNICVLLADFGYLETIKEYDIVLKFALDNYKKNQIYFK